MTICSCGAVVAHVASVHIAPIVALNALYSGKLGLMHGPAGGGKTTVLANVVARITLGAEWLGRPTIKGTVLVVTEDRDTWKDALETAGADQTMVRPVKWRDLARKVADAQPVAVVIDTMQYVASIVGSGELDSAREVDIILRPLERLCRDNGVAVIVTDHEPWSDGSGPTDAASGTKKRPRHSGAKVATCDYILRCSVDNGITTIERGSKVRRGIAVDRIAAVDLHGNPVAAPPSGTANGAGQSNASTEPTILYDGDREIVVPAAAQWLRLLLPPGEALTFTELEARAGCKAARTRKARKLLVEAGIWRVAGTGKRGDPMRVEVAVSDSRPEPETTPPGDLDANPSGRASTPMDVDRTGMGRASGRASHPIGGRESGRESGRASGGPDRDANWTQQEAVTMPDEPSGELEQPAPATAPASGDRAEGSDYWRREYDALIASGVDPREHDCIATCCRCDRARTRCAITPAGPVCQVCRAGLPRGVRPAEDYPGYATAAAQLDSEKATDEQKASAIQTMRRLLAAEFEKAAKARGMTDYRNPYADAPENKAAPPLAGPAPVSSEPPPAPD